MHTGVYGMAEIGKHLMLHLKGCRSKSCRIPSEASTVLCASTVCWLGYCYYSLNKLDGVSNWIYVLFNYYLEVADPPARLALVPCSSTSWQLSPLLVPMSNAHLISCGFMYVHCTCSVVDKATLVQKQLKKPSTVKQLKAVTVWPARKYICVLPMH